MWFKNLYLFKFEKDFSLSAEELHEELSNKPFAPCTSTQRESLGWVAPLGANPDSNIQASFTHASSKNILLTMARQERLLPASVIREELEEKVARLEPKRGRPKKVA